MQVIALRKLLAKTLLLRTINCFHWQLVPASQIQHDLAEALPLKLHQKFDGISSSPTGEAVIKLLLRGNCHRRLAVVVKRANSNEFSTFLLEHHMLTDHINDVGALLDGVDGARVKTGHRHASILRDPRSSWLFMTMLHVRSKAVSQQRNGGFELRTGCC